MSVAAGISYMHRKEYMDMRPRVGIGWRLVAVYSGFGCETTKTNTQRYRENPPVIFRNFRFTAVRQPPHMQLCNIYELGHKNKTATEHTQKGIS